VNLLRDEIQRMRDERDRAQAIANTAESLLKTEQAAQKHLAQQLRQAEADMMTLRADLGFFERLLPAQGDGLALRGVQFEPQAPGQMRYQLLVMQRGKGPAWSWAPPQAQPLTVKQYARIEGTLDHPPRAVVETVEVRVSDNNGGVRASQTVKL
jgi:hypothetical protein